MSDTPIDVFIDLPSSPGPVQAGRLWSHFHHVHVTHSQIAKKLICYHRGIVISDSPTMAIDYASAGVGIPAGAGASST